MLEDILELARGFGNALGMVVRHIPSGEVAAFNENHSFSAASVIKLPILWEFYRQIKEGEIDSQEKYVLKNEDKVGISCYDSGILREMHEGMELTYGDLATLMIVISDDTATNVLLEKLNRDTITATMRRLGLKGTYVRRMMMDYEKIKQGIDNETTSADMDLLLALLIDKNSPMPPKFQKEMLATLSKQQINTAIPLRLSPALRIAHKTGSIIEFALEHDVGIVYDEEQQPALALSLMSRGLKDSKNVFGLIAQMAYQAHDKNR